jgi:hypothetical protein
MKIHAKYVYATNAYSQERDSSERPSNIKVWRHGHRGKDQENPYQLCTPMAEALLMSCQTTWIEIQPFFVAIGLRFASLCQRHLRRR